MHKRNFRTSLFLLFSIFSCIKTFAQTTIPYGKNAEAGQFAMLNGIKIYYEAYGEGKPLLLIHGNSTATVGWSKQIEYFSKKYKVYSIDCRGRGQSELGKDTLTYIQQAKDAAALLETLHLDSVAVIGKSDGAIVALLMGIYYPKHISKIVSFAANLSPDTTALYSQIIKDIKKERRYADSMLQLKDTTQNWYLVQQKNRMMEFQPHITAKDLARIQVPVLVMSCDRDVIKEEHTLFIYKHIPMASLCFVPGETHHLPKQNPDLFNLLVDKFLSEPFKGQAARF